MFGERVSRSGSRLGGWALSHRVSFAARRREETQTQEVRSGQSETVRDGIAGNATRAETCSTSSRRVYSVGVVEGCPQRSGYRSAHSARAKAGATLDEILRIFPMIRSSGEARRRPPEAGRSGEEEQRACKAHRTSVAGAHRSAGIRG